MQQFTRNDLPCLGMTFTRFSTLRQARAFARWAESETRNDRYPCEAWVYRHDDRDEPDHPWEVKVSNW